MVAEALKNGISATICLNKNLPIRANVERYNVWSYLGRVMRSTGALCVLMVLGFVGCVAKSPKDAVPQSPPKKNSQRTVILVHDRAFDFTTGEFVGDFDSPRYWPTARPVPGQPGWYEIEGGFVREGDWHPAVHINPQTKASIEFPIPRLSRFDEDTGEIVRLNEDGSERWRHGQGGWFWNAPDGVREKNFRPSSIQIDGGAFYVSYPNELMMKDDATGEMVWSIPESCGDLLLREDRLFAVFTVRNNSDKPSEVKCIDRKNGETAFVVPLWKSRGSDARLTSHGERFLVRSYGQGETHLFDSGGKTCIRTNDYLEPLVESRSEGWIASGTETVSRWSTYGTLVWACRFSSRSFARELVELADGDIIVAEYFPFAASEIEVTRLSGETGQRKWTTTCPVGEDIWHSKYSNNVYVEDVDGMVVVCSQQSMCVFVEVLNSDTGERVHRWQLSERLANPD